MKTESISRKNKINPALDKIIKYYIQFLEKSGLPADSSWIALAPEGLRIWEEKGMLGWR